MYEGLSAYPAPKGEGSVSRKESLLRGAAALAVAGLIIKVSNLLVRIPLTRLIDAEGIGIYMIALPAFNALYHLAAGGVPVAVQNLVAEYTARGRYNVAEQVRRMALVYSLVAGGIGTAVLLAGAAPLAKLLGEPRAYWPLVAIAPAILLFAVDSSYQHALRGRKLMTPSATSNVLETMTKVAVTLGAAYLLLPHGKAVAAGGAALGMTVGALVSVTYMVWVFAQIRREDGPSDYPDVPRSTLARRMIRLAWPVTIGNMTLPLLSLVDVGIVQRGFLKAGYEPAMATKLYGAYSGIAVQVVWFPIVLTNALANALTPVLTAAKAQRNQALVRERVLLGLRATGLICLPVTLGVVVLAEQISLLFGDRIAVTPLIYMAPVAYLGPMTWLIAAQLQALGNTGAPMRNFTIGYMVKIGLDAALAPIPGIDIRGVSMASTMLFLVSSWLNARALEKELGEPLPWFSLLRGPIMGSVVMAGALLGLEAGGLMPRGGVTSILAALMVAPVLYAGTLVVTKALTWDELRDLSGPLGTKLERWFQSIWPWG